MSVRDTSLEALEFVKPTIGEKQKLVLDTIASGKRPVNNQELANKLRMAINSITPRTNELVEMGKVELAFKGVYPVTNRRVCYWRVAR